MARKAIDQMRKDFNSLEEFFKKLPSQIANAYDNFVQDNFQSKSFDGVKWPSRSSDKKQKGGRSRALLVKSGKLRRSIRWRLERSGNNIGVIFFTDIPYAKIHNEGLSVNKSVKVRKHKRRTKGGIVSVKKHARKMNLKMPKRQFIGASEQFNEAIINEIQRQLEKLIR